MSSPNLSQAEARLLTRLLTDRGFRAAFRHSPAAACRAGGLGELSDTFTGAATVETLEHRESKSSLAGVFMAVAAEVIGVAELTGLLSHPPAPTALPAADMTHGPTGSGSAPLDSPGGSLPSDGPAVTAAAAQLLGNARLSASAPARAALAQAAADPRVVSVLRTVLAHHAIVLSDVLLVSSPVHAVSLVIASVDGQPVGPSNIAARDVLSEIAGFDAAQGPTEVSSPWAIQAPGFYADPTHPDEMRLSFLAGTDLGVTSAGSAASAAARGAAEAVASGGSPHSPDAARGGDGVSRGTSASTGASERYVSPLPADARIGRTDMGVDIDLSPGEPILAIGDSRVLGIMPNWYQGQPYVALQLLDGPDKGRNYYVAEQIVPLVRPDEVVRAGQVIAHYANTGTGIEMGWAGPNWEQTLAQAQGNTGDASHNDAPAGVSFRDFLTSLGHSNTAHADALSTPAPADAASARTSVYAPAPHPHRFQRTTVEFTTAGSRGSGDVAWSAPEAAAAAGPVSLGSPLLTTGQAQFAARLAQITGLDPRVVAAWELAEESGAAAAHYQSIGYFDWLNIGQFDAGPGQIAFDAAFKDPITAAEQTARFLQGRWGGASASIRAILTAVGKTPQQQLEAIAGSDWASSHYGGGANLLATYQELAGMTVHPT